MDLQEQLDLEPLLHAIDDSIQQEMPGFSFYNIFENLMQGNLQIDLEYILAQIVQAVSHDMTVQFSFIGQMIVLAVLYALLSRMENSFSGSSIQKLSGLLMQAIAVLLLLKSGNTVLLYGQEAVVRLAELMQILLPVQLLLMTGLGNIQTAGLLKPSLVLIVQIAVWFFRTILIPLITVEFVLKLVNSLSDTYRLDGMAAFLRKLILTVITFSMMLFLAVLSIQGISGHVLDRLSLRTVKYVTGNAIPVVGSTLSGLLETLMSGAVLIRGAIGFIGLLAVLLLTVLPACKLLVLYFLYHFTAAVLQPVGDTHITGLLEQAANTYMLVFAVVALTGVFFFFMILIVLAASGAVLGG